MTIKGGEKNKIARIFFRMRHFVASIVIILISLLAGLANAPTAGAAPLGNRADLVNANSAVAAAAGTSSAPCTFGGSSARTACTSSDPTVTKVAWSGSADCSTTYFEWQISWGAGLPVQTVDGYGSAPNQAKPIASHMYSKPGTYDISVTGKTTNGGPCYWVPSSYTFTLSATAPPGEACVINAPKLLAHLAGHVAWGFKLADGDWEFGGNEGGLSGASSKTWYKTGSQQVMLATFLKGGPYQEAGYYVSVECVTVSEPKVVAAEQQVLDEQGERYILFTQDCETQAYNVLSKYGVIGLPSDATDVAPNTWYEDLRPSAGFGPPKAL